MFPNRFQGLKHWIHSRDTGDIVFDGKNVDIGNPKDAIPLGIGTIYQDVMNVPSMQKEPSLQLNQLGINQMKILWSGV